MAGTVPTPTERASALSILLVDDDAGLRDMLQRSFEREGHRITAVADGEAALACAAHFKEPGPAATGIPIPAHARKGQQIKIEVVAMLGTDGKRLARRHSWPDSLWDWHVHLPYKHGLKCEDMIFLGGQVYEFARR